MAHFLLCNDDGYQAKGIGLLAQILSEKGHRVSVVAPHEERSGQSHAMSFFTPVQVKQVAQNIWSVKGTPADCAAIALYEILKKDPPDMVISGINHGYNLGWDVHYSGTVGAATEAAFLGFPAIAVSMCTTIDNLPMNEEQLKAGFEDAARLVERIASLLIQTEDTEGSSPKAPSSKGPLHCTLSLKNWPQKAVLNINHPGIKPKGLKIAPCRGDSIFVPRIQKFELESNNLHIENSVYILGGSFFKGAEAQQNIQDDVSYAYQGMATLTLLDFRQGHLGSEEILKDLCQNTAL